MPVSRFPWCILQLYHSRPLHMLMICLLGWRIGKPVGLSQPHEFISRAALCALQSVLTSFPSQTHLEKGKLSEHCINNYLPVAVCWHKAWNIEIEGRDSVFRLPARYRWRGPEPVGGVFICYRTPLQNTLKCHSFSLRATVSVKVCPRKQMCGLISKRSQKRQQETGNGKLTKWKIIRGVKNH